MIPMGKCIYSTGTFSSLCILARAEQNIDERQRKMKQDREMGARENNESQSVWGAQHMSDDILKSPQMLTHLNFSKTCDIVSVAFAHLQEGNGLRNSKWFSQGQTTKQQRKSRIQSQAENPKQPLN